MWLLVRINNSTTLFDDPWLERGISLVQKTKQIAEDCAFENTILEIELEPHVIQLSCTGKTVTIRIAKFLDSQGNRSWLDSNQSLSSFLLRLDVSTIRI